ncbi:MAG: HD domain-containing phosphohydrolase [Candidatus Sumerlaeaceae bacterium]
MSTRAERGVLAILTVQREQVVATSGDVRQILGRGSDTIEGKELQELFAAESVAALHNARNATQSPSVRWLALTALCPAGEPRDVEGIVIAGGNVSSEEWLLVLQPQPPLQSTELDAMPWALLMLRPLLDPQGDIFDYRIRFINSQACKLFGVEKKHVEGRLLTEAPMGFEREWIRRVGEAYRTQQCVTFLGQTEAGDRYFELTAFPTQHADLACCVSDVTNQVERQEQLETTLQRLEYVLESSPIILHVLRYDERLGDFVPAWVSPSVAYVLGYTVEEALRPEWWLEVMNPEDRDVVARHSREVLAKGQQQLEYRVRTKWGREIWIQDFARVTKVHDGRPVEVLVTWTDITRRVINEQLLKEEIHRHQTIYELGRAFAGEITAGGVARAAVRKCAENVEASLAWIGLKEIDGTIRPIASWPENHPFLDDLQVRWDNTPLSKGPTGRAVVTGYEQSFPDFTIEPSVAPWRSRLNEFGFRSGFAVPLIHKGQVLGNLTLYSDKSGHFVGRGEQIIREVAPFIAAELSGQLSYDLAQQRLQQLEGLRRIDLQVIADPNPELVMAQLLQEVIGGLQVDAAAVVSISDRERGKILLHSGFTQFPPNEFTLPSGGVRHKAVKTKSRVVVENPCSIPTEFAPSDFFVSQGFAWICVQPIMTPDRVLALLELYSRRRLTPTQEWFILLETLAGQGAIGLELAWHVAQTAQHAEELQLAYSATMEGWVKALEMRDRETEGHTHRVTALTLRLAKLSGVPEEQLPHIERGALLHDLGKIGIPDTILHKPGPLTDQEWVIMRRHPVLAKEMLEKIEYLQPAMDIPYCHHEKWDGTGYPRGLAGEAIPWPARLFAVTDVWDALTSDRPYRKAWPKGEALAYIAAQSGKHFDPRAVDLFLQLVSHGEA